MTDYAQLNKYIGKPFGENKRGPDAYDCWGLVEAVLKEFKGYTMPTWFVTSFAKDKVSSTMSKGVSDCLKQQSIVEVATPDDFDAALFMSSNKAFHIGLVVKGKLLHVSRSTKTSVLQDIDAVAKNASKVKFYRWVK